MRRISKELTIRDLINEYPSLILPDFQRKPGIYSDVHVTALITSILFGLDIGQVTLGKVQGKLWIIDGLQRLYSLFSFITNSDGSDRLYLSKNCPRDLKHLFYEKGDGRDFETFPISIKEKILSYKVNIRVLLNCTRDQARDQYYMMNSNMKAMNSEEKRRSICNGKMASLRDEIAQWGFWTERNIISRAQDTRQKTEEYVTELLMVLEDNEIKSKKSDRLSEFIQNYDSTTNMRIKVLRDSMKHVTETIDDILPNLGHRLNMFRKPGHFYPLFFSVAKLINDGKDLKEPEKAYKKLMDIQESYRDDSRSEEMEEYFSASQAGVSSYKNRAFKASVIENHLRRCFR